jgi:predicted ATPase
VRQYLGDVPAVRTLVEEALAISDTHGLALIGTMASVLKGWVLAREGEPTEGIAQMQRGFAAQRATGAELLRPWWLSLIAEACEQTGVVQQGLELLEEAERVVDDTHERYWEAEIHRLRGHLLLAAPRAFDEEVPHSAEERFMRALDIARRQGARSLELRAAVSLSRLWRAEGRQREAREFLALIYEWYSECRETPDLRAAAALLTELAAESSHVGDLIVPSGGR